MNRGRSNLGWMLALATFVSSAQAYEAPAEPLVIYLPIYLELDGHWYHFEQPQQAGQAPWVYYGSNGYLANTAVMANCRRENGGWIGTEPPMMYYGPMLYGMPVTSFAFRKFSDSVYWMHYASRYGDVICDSEIPSPIPDQIFANGFDLAGSPPIPGETILINGFERS